MTNESTDSFSVTVTSPHGYINDYAVMGIEWVDAGQGGKIRRGSAVMMAPAVRRQLIVTTLLFWVAALFVTSAMQLALLAGGWTVWGIWTATLGLIAMAAAIGPWLWAQTVRGQRFLLGTILVGSGGGLLALLPGMSYLVVAAAQAALAAAVVAEARSPR